MDFHIYAPGRRLEQHVVCLWTMRGPAGAAPLDRETRLIPDGTHSLLFNLGSPYWLLDARGERRRVCGSHLAGPRRTFIRTRQTGAIDLVGVRFRPHGVHAWVRQSMVSVREQTVAAVELFGARTGDLEERLAAEALPGERVALLRKSLEAHLHRPGGDPLVERALSLVSRSGGAVRVQRLADDLGVGRRWLERRFAACVGLTPKEFLSLQRFHAAFGAMIAAPEPRWSELALESGYFDQSHLVNEFKKIAGVAPTSYLERRDEMADVFGQRS